VGIFVFFDEVNDVGMGNRKGMVIFNDVRSLRIVVEVVVICFVYFVYRMSMEYENGIEKNLLDD